MRVVQQEARRSELPIAGGNQALTGQPRAGYCGGDSFSSGTSRSDLEASPALGVYFLGLVYTSPPRVSSPPKAVGLPQAGRVGLPLLPPPASEISASL